MNETNERAPIISKRRGSSSRGNSIRDSTSDHHQAAQNDNKKSGNVRLVCLLILMCLYSTMYTGRIMCSPVILFYLNLVNDDLTLLKTEISWIGQLYEMLSFFLVPLFCGIIDKFGISYRIAIIFSITLQLIGNVAGALTSSMNELPLTYGIIPGVASSIALGTIILMADEYVEEKSRYRIIATTYCQGAFSATFFFSYLWSLSLYTLDWKYVNLILAAIFTIIGAIMVVLIPEDGLKWRPRRIENLEFSEKSEHLKKPLSEILLGLSSSDTVSSPSLLIWLLYRLFYALSRIGVYIHTAKDIRNQTNSNSLIEIYGLTYPTPTLISGYLFSSGEILTFLIGALMGYKYRGRLNHIYAVSSMLLCIFFVAIYLFTFNKSSSEPIKVLIQINYLLAGCMVGFQDTFAFAASEEATLIPARRIYPFTLMVTGLAFILSPILDYGLSYSHDSSIEFLIYGIFALMNSGLIFLILYRNYNYLAMLKRRKNSNIKLKINAMGTATHFQ